MMGLAIILTIGLLVTLAWATWFTQRRLRMPPRRTYAAAVSKGVPGDPAELESPRAFESWPLQLGPDAPRPLRRLKLPVWEIEGDAPQGPAVILSPGWSDSRIGALARVEALAPMCSRIYAWDPPGHGDAPGKCMLGGCEHAALLSLLERIAPAAATTPGVILAGWSLGAGVSIAAAAKAGAAAPIVGVIAESPYRMSWTPAFNVIKASGFPCRINGPLAFVFIGLRSGAGPFWRRFDRRLLAAKLQTPLLVIHGDADAISPIEDGKAIAAAAPDSTFVTIKGAGHSNLWTDDRFAPQGAQAVQKFIAKVAPTPADRLTDTPAASV